MKSTKKAHWVKRGVEDSAEEQRSKEEEIKEEEGHKGGWRGLEKEGR